MISTLVKALVPDLLKELDDGVAVLRYGPGFLLEWYYESPWDGGEVENLLRMYYIRVYKRQYAKQASEGTVYGLHVKDAQAQWAEAIMLRAGVNTMKLYFSRNRNIQVGEPYTPWDLKNPAPPVGLAGALTATMYTTGPAAKRLQRSASKLTPLQRKHGGR